MTGLAEHTKRICRHLLGKPNEHLSTEDQWRYGSKGALAIEVAGKAAGSWFDHETKTGGGIIALIAREKGFSNSEAFAWLYDELGIGEARYQTTGAFSDDRPSGRHPGHVAVSGFYRGRDGAPVYRVVRRDCPGKEKKIHQERYDPATGDFIAKKGCMKGVRYIPIAWTNGWAPTDRS